MTSRVGGRKKERSGGNGKEGDEKAKRGSGEERLQVVRKEQDDCVGWFPGE